MHTPAQPWRSPRLCESLISRGIFFLAKPQRALRHAYPCAALAFSATLREPHFSRDVFSRQAAKGAKACTPLRSLGVLCAFARASFLAGYFILAKPQRTQRHAYPCAALAFSATPRPYSTASMIQSSMLRWSSEKLMATLYLWRLSSAKALR